jgi:hypothetical protein
MKPLALPFVNLWMEYGCKVSLASLVNLTSTHVIHHLYRTILESTYALDICMIRVSHSLEEAGKSL